MTLTYLQHPGELAVPVRDMLAALGVSKSGDHVAQCGQRTVNLFAFF